MNLFEFEITDEVMILDLLKTDPFTGSEVKDPFRIATMATVISRNLDSKGRPIYRINGAIVTNDLKKEVDWVSHYYPEEMLEKISEVSAKGIKEVLKGYIEYKEYKNHEHARKRKS